MNGDDLKQAVFGASDGATTSLGIATGSYFSGHASAIVAAVVGAAIAATVGMGGSEYISDPESSLRRASIMAGATLVGSVLPGIPFMFGHSSIFLALTVAATLLVGGAVATVRARTTGWTKAIGQVYGIFLVVSILATLAGLLAPGAS